MCYLLPRGVDSIDGREDFQPRFFIALAITFAIGVLIARIGQTSSRYAPVALFAYLGVLTPPIVVFLSIVIRCAGAARCLS